MEILISVKIIRVIPGIGNIIFSLKHLLFTAKICFTATGEDLRIWSVIRNYTSNMINALLSPESLFLAIDENEATRHLNTYAYEWDPG